MTLTLVHEWAAVRMAKLVSHRIICLTELPTKITIGFREYNFMWVTKGTTVTFGIATKILAATGESIDFYSDLNVLRAPVSKCYIQWLVRAGLVFSKQRNAQLAIKHDCYRKGDLIVCSRGELHKSQIALV